MAASPTSRSLALLRERGYMVQVVERFNQYARIRQDLFGFIDVLAVRASPCDILGVQCCTVGAQSKRIAKINAEPRAGVWLAAGCRIEVHGWALRGPRGKRKTWDVTVTPIS